MVNERVIEKIKRCLALSKSANETESATALRHAHALMSKYRISMDDIKLTDVTESVTDETVPAKLICYQAMLANIIAEKFGCEVYVGYNYEDGKCKLSFLGIDLYSSIASYAFDVLFRQLKKARGDYITTSLSRVRIRKNKTARADVFCEGWVHSVAKLIDTLVPPSVDKALIALKMETLQLKNTDSRDRGKSISKSNTDKDYSHGRDKGSKAQLYNAVNRTESKKVTADTSMSAVG